MDNQKRNEGIDPASLARINLERLLADWDISHYGREINSPSGAADRQSKMRVSSGPPKAEEALVEACAWGNLELAKLLIKLGANACAQQRMEINWGLASGKGRNASFMSVSSCSLTPLMAAALWGRDEVVDFLADLVDVNQRVSEGGKMSTPPGMSDPPGRAISFAAAGGHKKCMQILLSRGAFPWNIDGDGKLGEPLEAAVAFGDAELCGFLAMEISILDGNLSIGLGGGLAAAAKIGRLDIMASISRHGAGDWGAASPWLALAAAQGGAQAVREAELLAPGLARTSCDEHGNTPLIVAASLGWAQGSEETVDALLPISNLQAANRNGETALAVALRCSAHKLAEKLWSESEAREAGPDRAGLLAAACVAMSPSLEWIRKIAQDAPGQINKPDSHGSAPIVLAVRHRNEEAALELLSLGASVNHDVGAGNTLLHLAVDERCGVPVLDSLLNVCDPNKQNKDGATPLMMLLESEWRDGFDCLASRSCMRLKNNKGLTALDVALKVESDWPREHRGRFSNYLRALCEQEVLRDEVATPSKPARRARSL